MHFTLRLQYVQCSLCIYSPSQQDCLSVDPLRFLPEVESQVDTAYSEVLNLYAMLNSNLLPDIVEACGDRKSILVTNATLHELETHLSNLKGALSALIELTGCSAINPVFRRLLYGSTCTSSVDGLATMYLTLLSISILGFVIVTTRAAMFNPVIRGRRSKRREKEFTDYKVFMSRFYNTTNWEMDKIPEFDDPPPVKESNSNDTHSTSQGSPTNAQCVDDDNDCLASKDSFAPTISTTDHGPVFVNLAAPDVAEEDIDNCDDDDSYDSTYSVDNEGIHEVESTSSNSFLMYFRPRRGLHLQESSSTADGQDEIVSTTSSSSMLSRILTHRRAKESLRGDALTIHPSNHFTLDSTKSHLRADDDESDDENENDDNDSTVGVLFSPPALRYPLHLHRPATAQTSKSRRSNQDEMQPLSPSSRQNEANQRNHNWRDTASDDETSPKFQRSSCR